MIKLNLKSKRKSLLRGSGVLVVILSAIVFSIYISSTFAEEEHFAIMQNRYENSIVQNYQKDVNNVEQIYETLYNKYYK